MLEKLLKPLTTSTSIGVTIRYLTAVVGAILAILGIAGLLTPEQIEAISKQIEVLTANLPGLLAAFGTLMTTLVTIYAAWTKASSDRGAEVARQTDQQIAPNAKVVIQTPEGQPDIIVQASK